jgi:hypothetical protein
MIAVAMGFDFMEFIFDFIPIAGQVVAMIIDITATMTFSLWFAVKNVSLSSPKAVGRFWVANIVELIPIPLLDFCLTTVGVILMTRGVRQEDEGKTNSTPNPPKKSQKITRKKRG